MSKQIGMDTSFFKVTALVLITLLLTACFGGKKEEGKGDDCQEEQSHSSGHDKDDDGDDDHKNDKGKGHHKDKGEKPKKCSKNDPAPAPAPLPQDPSRVCTVDKFKQDSTSQFVKKVDLLFVLDTSGSMSDDWNRVAQNVVQLVNELPQNTDIRYAVLLGHVGKWQGKLFYSKKNSHSNRPAVLSNQDMSTHDIGQELHKRFAEGMKISDPGSGESLFHSLYYAATTKAAENQQLGFFRSDAALSILFMSDEQEIGAHFPKPQADGLPDRCDEAYEEGIKAHYYTKLGINTDTVVKALKALKGDMPMRASAFINITKGDLFTRNSKNASCLYDSLGYGYFDIVAATKGIQYSIQADRAAGMTKVGQCVRDSLMLVHDFKLSWPSDEIDPATIQASVDDGLVPNEYTVLTNTVHLANAGAAGSSIEISYCKPEQRKDWNIAGFGGQATTSSVSLHWDTPEVATKGKVLWGIHPNNLDGAVEESVSGINHLVTVDGLSSDTTYYFQAVSIDEFGLEKRSIVIDVRTLGLPTDTTTDTSTATDTGTATDTATSTDTTTATDTATATDTTTDTATATDTTTATDTGTTTDTSTATATDTSTNTNTNPNTTWQVLGFDGTTSPTTATLIWQTPGAATRATIRVGSSATAADIMTVDVPDYAESHIVTIDGLTPSTIYFFQVTAVDQYGRAVESVVISKKTKAQ